MADNARPPTEKSAVRPEGEDAAGKGSDISYGSHDPLAGKAGYPFDGSKRPPPPWESNQPDMPPVENAPDTGKYGKEDLPSTPPESAGI